MENKNCKAVIWKYFKIIVKDDTSYTKCNICQTDLRYNYNTSAMRTHIKTNHQTEWEKVKELEETQKNSMLQPQLNFPVIELPKQRLNEINEAIVKWICADMRPFSIVQSTSFKNLLNLLEPRYKLPSSNSLKSICDELYEKEKSLLKEELTKAHDVSLTTDTWTGLNDKSYMTVTAHFFNESKSLSSKVIGTKEVSASKKAEELGAKIKKLLEEFSLLNKCNYITTDSAPENENLAKVLNMKQIHCYGHLIHNVVKKVFEIEEIDAVLTKCRKLVRKFKKSPKAYN